LSCFGEEVPETSSLFQAYSKQEGEEKARKKPENIQSFFGFFKGFAF
jgi:hypothetical protein